MRNAKPDTRHLCGVALLAVIGIATVPTTSFASECVTLESSTPVLDEFRRAALVFVGHVESIDVVTGPESFRYRVRFRMIEAFKGSKARTQTLDFVPIVGSFVFEKEQRVLVYAYAAGREGYVTHCTRTRLSGPADEEVSRLRQLAKRE